MILARSVVKRASSVNKKAASGLSMPDTAEFFVLRQKNEDLRDQCQYFLSSERILTACAI